MYAERHSSGEWNGDGPLNHASGTVETTLEINCGSSGGELHQLRGGREGQQNVFFHAVECIDAALDAKARAVLAIEALIATGTSQGRPRASSLMDSKSPQRLRALGRQCRRWPSC